MTTLGALYCLLTLALVPHFGFLALVTAAALTRRTRPGRAPAGVVSARFLVVIPAHDEEQNIAATVKNCRALAYDPDAFHVVVIADNCSDATAKAAVAAGAEVLERHDTERQSKGHALEFFFRHLAETGQGGAGPFDAFVVIDADTAVSPDLLARFSDALGRGVDWAQSYYSVSNPDGSWRTRLMTYALSLFNGVWLLGQDRLGLSVGFRGNGMYFSARGLSRVPWKAYGLVEDQEFSWTLRAEGERVRFLPETGVFGEMVSRGKAAVSQRNRWETGRGALLLRFFRPVLSSRKLTFPGKIFALIDLTFPPLTRLLVLLLLALTIHPLAYHVAGLLRLARLLRPLHFAMALTLAIYAVSPFLIMGLPWKYAASLSALPYYVVWKFFAKFRSRTRSWVRTPREPTAPEVLAPSHPSDEGFAGPAVVTKSDDKGQRS